MRYYSASTKGFYSSKTSSAIPEDAVEISEGEYQALLEGQGNWKVIALDDDGRPALIDPPAPTPAEIEADKVAIVQRHMDAAAQALRYDNITTAITYAEEPAVPKFQAEGQAFRAWRSLVWATCYQILAEVNDGLRDIPTDEELIAALPALELPAA